MDLFDELKTTWQAAPEPDLPDAAALHRQLAAYQRRRRLFHLSQVALLLGSAATLIWVMVSLQSRLWTTRAGEVLFLLCMAGAYRLRAAGERRHKAAAETLPVADYLAYLQQNAEEACNVAPRRQIYLIVLLAVGFSLYMYELLSGSTAALLIGYSLVALYMLAIWFVLRPYLKRRHKARIQKLE